MAWEIGSMRFSGNFSVLAAAPFDDRQVCETKADLLNSERWIAADGSSYAFPGMLTVVWNDVEDNIGLWWYRGGDISLEVSWVHVISGEGPAGIPEAPEDGKTYARQNASWVEIDKTFITMEAVDVLPDIADAERNVIYLVPNAKDPTIRDEYVAVTDPDSTSDPKGLKWELLGSTSVDLSQYVKSEDLIFTQTGGIAFDIGGAKAGTVINGLTVMEFLDLAAFPELNPTLTNPSLTFRSNSASLVEFGTVKDIIFTAEFNAGRINPQYDAASPDRSGAPNNYTFTGIGLPTTLASTEKIVAQTVTDHAFTTLGISQWSAKVSYDAGVQPLSNKGNNFNTPLPAGDTQVVNTTITTVNPIFATDTAIATLTKQTLIAPTSNYIEVDFIGEDDANKQTIQYPKTMAALTGLKQLNTLSGAWDDVDASQFTVSDVSIDIGGVEQPYYQLVHNKAKIGARSMRFML